MVEGWANEQVASAPEAATHDLQDQLVTHGDEGAPAYTHTHTHTQGFLHRDTSSPRSWMQTDMSTGHIIISFTHFLGLGVGFDFQGHTVQH